MLSLDDITTELNNHIGLNKNGKKQIITRKTMNKFGDVKYYLEFFETYWDDLTKIYNNNLISFNNLYEKKDELSSTHFYFLLDGDLPNEFYP